MKKLPFLLLFLLNVLASFSQQYDKNWLISYDYFPGSIKRLLLTWNPIMSIDSMYAAINFGTTTITMSDNNGNFLFASNSAIIIDATGNQMLNGDNINMSPCSTMYSHFGSPVPQSTICLPYPEDSNIYYIFHLPCEMSSSNQNPLDFMYTVIDITGNAGLGAVSQKNILLFSDTMALGQLTACRHSDGKSWWIFVPQKNSNVYHRILFTRQGVFQSDTIQCGTILDGQSLGRAVFSSDGKHYARYCIQSGLSLMDFDRCTGRFSNESFISASLLPTSTNPAAGSIEFSPNSQLLYVFTTQYVFQYNLNDSIPLANRIILDTAEVYGCPYASNYAYGQLSPDGKILINNTAGNFCISSIEYPDSLGLNCLLTQHSVTFPMPLFAFAAFPNNPNYRLQADTFDCVINSIDQFQYSQPITLYPNPARSKMSMKGDIENGSRLEIYDIQGKLVLPITLFQGQAIDILGLKPGVFILKVFQHKKNVQILRFLVK
jgi:hypothetical protein